MREWRAIKLPTDAERDAIEQRMRAAFPTIDHATLVTLLDYLIATLLAQGVDTDWMVDYLGQRLAAIEEALALAGLIDRPNVRQPGGPS